MKIMLHQKQVYFNANHRTITTDNRTLSTVAECCKKLVKADRLPNLHCGGSIESTTKHEGNRNPYSSGIFLSKFYLSTGEHRPKSIEFAVRLISRNKAEFICTNKASHSCMVVETLSHPIQQEQGDITLLLTKHEKIKMLFKFLLLGEKRLTVRIRAKSEAEARQRIQFTSPAICIARFSDNLTACSANSLHETGKPCTKDAMFKAEDCMKQQARLYKTAQNLVQNDNLLITEQKTILHPLALIGYSAPVVAKSTAERGNSNNQSVANDSTPLTRAFFVRSLRTPKENTTPKIGERSFLSMVERNGQRLIVGCEPLIAVFHPVTLYRQAWKLAVDSQKSISGVVQMFYKFLFTGSRLRITVYARTLAEAYKRLPIPQANSQAVLIARLPVQGGIYA